MIEISKSDYTITFSITEIPNETEIEEENQNREFIAILYYEYFLYLSESYYLLFNGSLDDIYSDLLFNFNNNNFELRKVKRDIKLFFYVFNLKQLNNREAYFCVNISAKVKIKEQEQKKVESIKPIMSSIINIKNEVIHLDLGKKLCLESDINLNKDNIKEQKDENINTEFINNNNNNDNNCDEETDTKNNIEDLKNDIQTFTIFYFIR